MDDDITHANEARLDVLEQGASASDARFTALEARVTALEGGGAGDSEAQTEEEGGTGEEPDTSGGGGGTGETTTEPEPETTEEQPTSEGEVNF
jgi:hypothetical protein